MTNQKKTSRLLKNVLKIMKASDIIINQVLNCCTYNLRLNSRCFHTLTEFNWSLPIKPRRASCLKIIIHMVS